jgi:predicted RNA polymerase sigma factor
VLTTTSQIALTLRAVGGLTTREIAHALLVPEQTMAQRISRAKQRIKSAAIPFRLAPSDYAARLNAVLHVVYLIFNEGYTSTSGRHLHRVELAAEAIRLARQLHRILPDNGEVIGLLALMLLTDARRPARVAPDGALIPLAEQDRGRWDQATIAEGIALITDAMSRTTLGPLQLQAAIAAVHDEASRAEDTDWPQILGLYRLLETMTANPVITLNRAVATAMVHGPSAGLALLDTLYTDERLTHQHRYPGARAPAGDVR